MRWCLSGDSCFLSSQILHFWITELGEDGVCLHLSVLCAVDRWGTNVILYNINSWVKTIKLAYMVATIFVLFHICFSGKYYRFTSLSLAFLVDKGWLFCIQKELLFSNWRLSIRVFVFNKLKHKWLVFENTLVAVSVDNGTLKWDVKMGSISACLFLEKSWNDFGN
jgi:type III secretory pathway component EscS